MPKMFSLQGSFNDGGVLTATLVSYGLPAPWWAPSGYLVGGVTFSGALSFGYTNVVSATQGTGLSLNVTTPQSPIGDSTGAMALLAQGDVDGMSVGQSLVLSGTESLVGGTRPPVSRTLVAGTFTRTF